jgi:hypothetical protein
VTHDAVDGDDLAEDDAFSPSQNRGWYEGAEGETDLMRFLVVILGVRTPPPRIDEPVTKIPLLKPKMMSTLQQLPE